MLASRLRRRPNIKTILSQRLVFAGRGRYIVRVTQPEVMTWKSRGCQASIAVKTRGSRRFLCLQIYTSTTDSNRLKFIKHPYRCMSLMASMPTSFK